MIIVPNVTPVSPRELLRAVLEHIATRDLTNTLVQVKHAGNQIACPNTLYQRQVREMTIQALGERFVTSF
jgi:hypothetical protein